MYRILRFLSGLGINGLGLTPAPFIVVDFTGVLPNTYVYGSVIVDGLSIPATAFGTTITASGPTDIQLSLDNVTWSSMVTVFNTQTLYYKVLSPLGAGTTLDYDLTIGTVTSSGGLVTLIPPNWIYEPTVDLTVIAITSDPDLNTYMALSSGYLVKYSLGGELQWAIQIANPAYHSPTAGIVDILYLNGHIYCSGSASLVISGYSKGILLKLDTDGNIVAQKFVGGPTDNTWWGNETAKLCTDGTYLYAAGQFPRRISNQTYLSGLFMKFDQDLNIQLFMGVDSYQFTTSIAYNPVDGHVYIAAITDTYGHIIAGMTTSGTNVSQRGYTIGDGLGIYFRIIDMKFDSAGVLIGAVNITDTQIGSLSGGALIRITPTQWTASQGSGIWFYHNGVRQYSVVDQVLIAEDNSFFFSASVAETTTFFGPVGGEYPILGHASWTGALNSGLNKIWMSRVDKPGGGFPIAIDRRAAQLAVVFNYSSAGTNSADKLEIIRVPDDGSQLGTLGSISLSVSDLTLSPFALTSTESASSYASYSPTVSDAGFLTTAVTFAGASQVL